MSLPTLESYADEARGLGYDEVVVRDWAPCEQAPEHVHPFDARGLVVRGEFWLTVDGRVRHLLPGDLFELPRGTPHAERYGPEGATYWAARRG